MIKKFSTVAEYNAAQKPTTESMVSLAGVECKYDGINVVTREPEDGDALYLDADGNKVFLKGGNELNTELLPASWTPVGAVIERTGRKVRVVNNAGSDQQYVGLWQFAITALSSTTPTISLRMTSANTYGNNTVVELSLESTDINATNAAAINQQIQAKATEVGSAQAWWAYLADSDYNITTDESQAACIIVQCDTDNHYNQRNVSGTGMTVANVTYRDSTSNSTNGVRKDGGSGGILNLTRGEIYYGASGTDDVTLGLTAAIMTLNAFTNSTNADVIAYKQAGGTYTSYLRDFKLLADWQPRRNVFALPNAQTMTEKYGKLLAPLRNGGTKAIFQALNAAWNVGYDADGLRQGTWHLLDVSEGLTLMADGDWTSGLSSTDMKRKYNQTLRKMGGKVVTNSVTRWFAQRYNANGSWFFSGTSGYLGYNYVHYKFRSQAVTLVDLD
jgi:hypothetical protein